MRHLLLVLLCLALAPSVPAAPVGGKSAATPLPAASAHDAILGVKVGMDVDDAHAALAPLGMSGDHDKDADEGKDKDADADNTKAKGADPDDALPEVWTLRGTPYAQIAFAADDDDKVLWVTGFARPGQGVPFARLGDLTRAAASGPTFAVWNVISPRGSYRVIARGRDGKAMTVSLLPLKNANPNGVFSPQIMPHTKIGDAK